MSFKIVSLKKQEEEQREKRNITLGLLKDCTDLHIDEKTKYLTISKGSDIESLQLDWSNQISGKNLLVLSSRFNHVGSFDELNFFDNSLYYDYYGFIDKEKGVFTNIERNATRGSDVTINDCSAAFWISCQSGIATVVVAVKTRKLGNPWLVGMYLSSKVECLCDLRDKYLDAFPKRRSSYKIK